jgi:TetR/AcrR family transcriptional repressor of nem operon
MARPREFDVDQAVADAMDVFWEHGYEGASLPDLLDGMGITRGSLYKAFTDKKTLFLQVMAAYEQQAVAPAVTILQDILEPDGIARIEKVFNFVVQSAFDGDQRGCLLCTAAAGSAAEDDDIAHVILAQLKQMRDGFATALAASDHTSQDALADHLLTHYVGLRIMVRAHIPMDMLQKSKTSLVRMLRQ